MMATDILDFLRAFEMPLSVKEALHYLKRLNDTFGKLFLYKKFFPVEYENSRANALPHDWEAYSERELEFFRLVDERLFPLPWEQYEEENLNDSDRDNQIYVQNLGPEWWDEGPEDLHQGWQILLILTGVIRPEDVELPEEMQEVVREQRPGEINWQKLEELCNKATSPLTTLPRALEMLDHSSDNVWLDYTYESPYEGAEWCEEDVLDLAEQYRAATKLIDQIMEFFEWLKERNENLREVVNIWNQSIKI